MTAAAVGGVWTYVVELGSALLRRGVAVDVAVMGAPLREDQRRQASSAGLTVVERPFRLEWIENSWADVEAAGHWLLELTALLRPDVVHRLIDDPAARTALATAARTQALRLTPARMATRYLHVYAQALASGPRPGSALANAGPN